MYLKVEVSNYFSAIFFVFHQFIEYIMATQKYNLNKKEKAKPKGHKIKEKEGKERAITNPNAPIGLQDIQPQSQEPKQRRFRHPTGPWTHPHRWTPPHTQSRKTMKKQWPSTPGSPPNLPRAAQAPGTQQRTPVQPPNLTATASRTRIIKPSFKHKEQFFSDNK